MLQCWIRLQRTLCYRWSFVAEENFDMATFYGSRAASCFNMNFTCRWMEPPEKSVSFGFITVRIQPSLKKALLKNP